MQTKRRVAILGHRGRMGHLACETVTAAEDLELVATIGRGDRLDEAVQAGADVLLDLTRPDVVMTHIRFAVDHGLDAVIGTSGIGAAELATIEGWLASTATDTASSVLVAPNFAIGAILAARFAREAAPFFDSAEIIETHHPAKLDAPSGTAVAVAESMTSARARADRPPMPDATVSDPLQARGARVGDVPVHAIRLSGAVARLEVLLGNGAETLTIRHDSTARESFMPGVLAALRAVGRQASARGLTVGLEDVLFATG